MTCRVGGASDLFCKNFTLINVGNNSIAGYDPDPHEHTRFTHEKTLLYTLRMRFFFPDQSSSLPSLSLSLFFSRKIDLRGFRLFIYPKYAISDRSSHGSAVEICFDCCLLVITSQAIIVGGRVYSIRIRATE